MVCRSVSFFVVDQFVHHLLGQHHAIAAGTQALGISGGDVPQRVFIGIGNRGVFDFIQRKTFAGVFHPAHDHVAGTHVGYFHRLVRLEFSAIFHRVEQDFARGHGQGAALFLGQVSDWQELN